MNVERCVALNNEILRYGWVHSGRDPALFESLCPPFFDESSPANRVGRTPDLISFLEQARTCGSNSWFSFHYWVGNLVCWSGKDDPLTSCMDMGTDEDGRYLLLYTMGNFGSHRLGLMFDQNTHLAIMCNTIYDTDTVNNGRIEWYPLETILQVWLDQIRKGIFIAVPDDGQERPHCSRTIDNKPWLLVTYTEAGLEETVGIFNKLVRAIEDRMPQKSEVPAEDVITGLVDEQDLHPMNIPDGFAYQFLRRAQRPRFQMIAPGLEVQQSTTFTKQPFWSYRPNEVQNVPPILLFRAVHPPDTDEEYKGPAGNDGHAFWYPFKATEDYAAGLYLSNCDENLPEDLCHMVLPFGIGANGYARKSDGALFGENYEDDHPEARDVFTELYSPGHDPFGLMHSHGLSKILKNWLGMIERGDWKVDENGVAGGIDKWKEADTEEHWDKYVLPIYES